MSTTASTLPPAQKKPINNMESLDDANNSPFSKPASKPSTASSIAVSDAPQGYELEPWPTSAVEDPNQYRRGGHHPILLGDHLGPSTNPSRFRVFHKLGYGGFGTVWLCQDMDEMRNNKRWKWRVVKVMSAKASNLKGGNADLKVMEMFEGVDRELLKMKGVSIPMESFWVEGPNGRHLCLMMEWLGPETTGLARCIGQCDGMMKDICFQLLEAMEFIHSKGLCHGDFRPQNILLRLKDGVDEWSEEQLLAVLGEPERAAVVVWDDAQEPQPVTGNPSVPEYLVGCGDIAYGSGLVSTKIAVVDYGVAYPFSDHPVRCTSGVAGPYASPEDLTLQQELIGVKADIWSLATAMFEIRFGFPPFGTNNHAPSSIPSMEESMGPVPPPFRATVREWYKLPAETEEELQDKSNSELSYVTTKPEELEKNRKYHLEERGAKDPMIFRILYPRSTNISPAQAEDIANQAKSNPAQLPLWTPIPRNPDRLAYYTRKDYLKLVPPKEEVEVFWDLVMSVFKWQPEDRATIEQIMEHPWFEGRKKRRDAVARPNLTTSESGIVCSISTKLGQAKANISNWFNILFWDKQKNKTKGSNTLSRYLWKPTCKTFGKISGVPIAIFWLLMIIPAAWLIKRRIDRGRNVFSPSSVRGLRH
ncbi:kinase-like protein [Neurospora crassa]|uniref:EKC/KEOPS complex subunit BUD32 n=1 Tax=Neurospora crassa (strain ATCC 24698 / 74-OR23-1A / CBS 708.71 / DSM 1257 / FGSC 987) TaxID=367110 RepID=Q7SAU1_NEUCR|nr:serine/threonine protein kinase-36 [Neurospora crassa OR74A]EAA33510.1 serine/threonine protein kinase-36 [Neurospora crassa OR74A]KHE78343.1 kinase-like protein [Neurospora crassa]|eukprot:XP_962746.1 serine/threonine protein kinase-36 [Neurospora crassa OR74A]